MKLEHIKTSLIIFFSITSIRFAYSGDLYSGCSNRGGYEWNDASSSKGFSLKLNANRGATKLLHNLNIYDRDIHREFRHLWKGCAGERRSWLSSSQYYTKNILGQGNSLAIEIQKTKRDVPNGIKTDKAMWSIRDSRTGGHIQMEEKIYVGFAIKIPSNIKSIVKNGESYMLLQFWQGSPWSPPMSIHLVNNGGHFQLEVRHLESINKHVVPQKIIGRVSLYKNSFQEFIVGYRPSYRNNGWVSVWKRNSRGYSRVIHKSRINSAYNPSITYYKPGSSYNGENASSKFEASIGLYRERQEHYIKVFYDDIRTGSTFSSVD